MDEALKRKIRRLGKVLNALERVSPALAGRLAFQIFCSPRRLAIRNQDAEFLATAKPGSLRFKNLKIRTYTWESQQPGAKSVLLLHGWESSSARWRKYVRGLQQAGFTVHAIDSPASGNSQGKRLNVLLLSEVVQLFIAKNGVPDIMVGHSLGAAAAVMSSALHGTPLPAKMILLGVFAESTRVIRDFGKLLGLSEGVIQAIFKEIEKRSGMPIEHYSVLQKAASLKSVRALIIHDADDEVAPVMEGRLIADAWEATYLQTSGFGHRLQDKSVVKAVVDFSLLA